ncbi:hypothetical protein GGI07_001094 [Coemansia sp. Benny D115]|nr:hypothetical protein GGI07_001094 [Coemansia sp. Benny D115]
MAAPSSGPKGLPNWRASMASTVLQLAVFAALVFFVFDSLSMSSVSSRILNRDVSAESLAIAAKSATSDGGPDFDVSRALADLEAIARTPHSLNDPRSIGVRDYLRQTIAEIIQGSGADFYDPVQNGTAAEFKSHGWLVYWEDSSLIVRVPGTGKDQRALLVQAHYDAVPMSHGAYDDGVGVTVCLELLRSLVSQPPLHPVLINIDWGEENGLFGAVLFARFHEWAEDVRAYLNLEAGGVGGRAMLFRASHPRLLAAYKSAAPRPCASLIGNNAFRLGVVKSDTDYSVYTTRYGIPGLDMAFTDRRSLYHTEHDASAAATADSVLSMGLAALRTARAIADSPDILPSLPRSDRLPARPRVPRDTMPRPSGRRLMAAEEAFGARRASIHIDPNQHIVVQRAPTAADNAVQDAVFYDVLSHFMVVRTYGAELLINVITAILGSLALVALQYPFERQLPPLVGAAYEGALDWVAATPADRLVLQLGQGGFFGALFEGVAALVAAYGTSLAASLGITGLLVSQVMPRLAYTHPILLVLLLFAATAAASTYVLATWACRSRMSDIRTMVWYSWCALRCLVLLVLVAPLNYYGLGILYREQLYAWAAIFAALLTALIDPQTGLGKAWRAKALSILNSSSPHMLPEDDGRESDNGQSSVDDASLQSGAHGQTQTDSHIAIVAIVNAVAAVRFVAGVLLPLLIGIDTMLRQLIVFKDHLVDGSPPVACTAIVALDLANFVMFLSPYVVSIMSDPNGHWLVSWISVAIAPYLERLFEPRVRQRRQADSHGALSPRARSHISLHTNRPHEENDESSGILSPQAYGADREEIARLIDHDDDQHDSDNEAADERIIVLDSGNHSNQHTGNGNTFAAGASEGQTDQAQTHGTDTNDTATPNDVHAAATDGTSLPARKGEAPETVGARMVYLWSGLWLILWVIAQLSMLGGEGYGEASNPLKVRVFQSAFVWTKCLNNKTPDARCSYSKLALSSPDSYGLSTMLRSAKPSHVPQACYTQSTRDFYTCNLVDNKDRGDDSSWSPETAIKVTSIDHSTTPMQKGTLFTVTLNFTAPETRTCFIDFGKHRGFSPQSYPNPRPVSPPFDASALPPVIDRVVLPVMERAVFVDGVSGATAPVVEPIGSRDPMYSGRIFAHKREFDDLGQFTAVIQYSVAKENVKKPAGVQIEVSCYFDVVDRHVPLLATIKSAAPKWATFTPAGNTLSTVTLMDVEI